MKPPVDAFRLFPFLRSVPEDTLAALAETADLVRFGADEVLFQAGDRLGELHLLLSGKIGATYLPGDTEDDEHVPGDDDHALVDVLLPVRALYLPAVLLDLPAPAGALTLTAGRLITVSTTRLREVVDSDLGLARPLLDYALREAHEQALEIRSLKLRSLSQRLTEYLLGLIENPDETPARFVLPVSKELLAAKLACSKEHMSRAFAVLRRFGVETERTVVLLRDVPALQDYIRTPSRREPVAAYPYPLNRATRRA
jgi:CRP-like cAMP-binding protein